MTTKMKQRYPRTYKQGRPTNGWDRGEQITDVADVKPGDVLITVSHQFQAENLVRVVGRDEPIIGSGFNYQYADCRTLQRSDGGIMFCHDFMLALPGQEFYRAIDRRPKRRARRIPNLPSWLTYPRRRS